MIFSLLLPLADPVGGGLEHTRDGVRDGGPSELRIQKRRLKLSSISSEGLELIANANMDSIMTK